MIRKGSFPCKQKAFLYQKFLAPVAGQKEKCLREKVHEFYGNMKQLSACIIKAKNVQCYNLNSLESDENLPTVKQNVMYKQSGYKAIQKLKK